MAHENPIFTCSFCDQEHVFNGWEHERAGICDTCAEKIANFWWEAHSGEYLTWDKDKKKRNQYVKKPIADDLRWEIFKRDNYACRSCGSNSRLRADHIIPEIKGGTATPENLQTLCVSCNSKKGARLVD